MSNFKSKLLSAFAWFFGFTFIIGGLSSWLAEEEVVAGILMLIGGGLLLPPIKRLLSNKKPSFSRGKVTTVGSIIICISYVFLLSNQDTEETSVVGEQIQTVDTDQENISVQDESYVEAYNNNMGVLTAQSKNGYYNISKRGSTSDDFFHKAYLKLGADAFNTDFFLYTHNIDGIRTGDAFKQKEAFDNIESYRNKARAYDVPTKIAINLLPFDTSISDDAYRDSAADYNVYSDDLILSSYDFDKHGFPYTTRGLITCPLDDNIALPYLDAPNFFYTPIAGLVLNLGMADYMEKDCFMHVPDEAIAKKIESARSKGKIAFTGTSYYTLKIKKDSNPDINSRSDSEFIGVLDAEEMYLHIIQEDKSLSKPLASDSFTSRHIS